MVKKLYFLTFSCYSVNHFIIYFVEQFYSDNVMTVGILKELKELGFFFLFYFNDCLKKGERRLKRTPFIRICTLSWDLKTKGRPQMKPALYQKGILLIL